LEAPWNASKDQGQQFHVFSSLLPSLLQGFLPCHFFPAILWNSSVALSLLLSLLLVPTTASVTAAITALLLLLPSSLHVNSSGNFTNDKDQKWARKRLPERKAFY
jgi:hypothetical protein